MTITAVTGASGFLGSAVVRALVAKGRRVRALVEPGADQANLEGLEVERAACDVTSEKDLSRALAGCDRLFHLAAVYKLWTQDPETIWRVNVEGTTAVMLAAQAAKISRIVHTSSTMAVGLAPRGKTDETARFNTFDVAGHYTMTKYASERVVMRFARAGLPVVVVNPSMPFGPGDRTPTPTGQTMLTILRGEAPAIGSGNLSVIDVDDAAAGHLLAEERGRTGERYILNGHDLSLGDFVRAVCEAASMKAPRVVVPKALGAAVALGFEAWSDWVSKREPKVTYREALFTQRDPEFSSEKAKRELGLAIRPLDVTIARAVAWFRAQGMAP